MFDLFILLTKDHSQSVRWKDVPTERFYFLSVLQVFKNEEKGCKFVEFVLYPLLELGLYCVVSISF